MLHEGRCILDTAKRQQQGFEPPETNPVYRLVDFNMLQESLPRGPAAKKNMLSALELVQYTIALVHQTQNEFNAQKRLVMQVADQLGETKRIVEFILGKVLKEADKFEERVSEMVMNAEMDHRTEAHASMYQKLTGMVRQYLQAFFMACTGA